MKTMKSKKGQTMLEYIIIVALIAISLIAAYKEYMKYFVKYPKLIEPFFTSEEKVIHKNTQCSKCGKNPIEGVLYKCLNCKKYDLCQNCEKIYGEKHGHNFLKLRKENYLQELEKVIETKNKDMKNNLI